MTKVYGTIKVRHEDASDKDCTVLTFTDRRVYDATRNALFHTEGVRVVDEFFGFKIFDSAPDAMETVRAFCRKPI